MRAGICPVISGRQKSIGIERPAHGAHTQRNEKHAWPQAAAYFGGTGGECDYQGSVRLRGVRQAGPIHSVDPNAQMLGNFRLQNLAHRGFRLGDENPLVGSGTHQMFEFVENLIRLITFGFCRLQ